ncbi:NADH-quinone oxidoreductase subunit L [Edaphobacter acidisoli]|uniref:NADH-quinone oxidoreductase subunit L n=1 Tax=Edaphobacter acidisoli TaxID=2040573 RepID=A0A916W3Z6_9BACT|nr:NADH-quinone oxidoreductase subunit L [Edaphobacter acidisoli]GGA65509.1 NADH-quinone oxidoreductase subunit L [Edaphobacter acidisoli]
MTWILKNLWLIPAIPALGAGLTAIARQRQRKYAATLAIGALSISLLLSLCAFVHVLHASAGVEVFNFQWLQFGSESLRLGWMLDPLTAVMLVMVSFVGLMVFIFSTGYMAHDENFTRFFCFLSLFAAAMLGVVIANSLLLLFMCWELVGLTSYLLIGFWYHKPTAAAAAKKAFITTRIGDLAFLIGMVWLYSQAGTLLFYDSGAGCMEHAALIKMAAEITTIGMAASTGIALLIFCGAIGKSGQVPLHVWLPDAMEGPTPVSALIHAATMVAAGVFLVARVYPLMSDTLAAHATTALAVVTWIGAITAVFAALIAVAQDDIKRILAYSTISQLGYMMIGLGVGGVAVGMFHLITHAFFKSLLFLGAGSVIHGCNDEQDIRRMGGLRRFMPVTFATYAVGMLALCGFPLFFSGFWSKDAILHAAHSWSPSHIPFYLGAFGALLTAFYMTRQVCYVFFGAYRSANHEEHAEPEHAEPEHTHHATPHESPSMMTVPLILLATFAILLGAIGTPAWPWFDAFINGGHTTWHLSGFMESGILTVMLSSSIIVFIGLGLGWWLYGRKPATTPDSPDALEQMQPLLFHALRRKLYVDELYSVTFIRWNTWLSRLSNWLDRRIWSGAVWTVSHAVLSLSWLARSTDNYIVNAGFDEGCHTVTLGGRLLSRIQNGRSQTYLRLLGAAFALLVIFLIWSGVR